MTDPFRLPTSQEEKQDFRLTQAILKLAEAIQELTREIGRDEE